jgi:type VI secretion system protein
MLKQPCKSCPPIKRKKARDCFPQMFNDSLQMISVFSFLTRSKGSIRSVLLVVLASFVVSACSIWGSSKSDQPIKAQSPNWSTLVLQASADVNSNTALEVDIVFAATPELQSMVQDLSSGKWFTARDSMMRTFKPQLNVIALELVPGQTVNLGKNDYSKFNAIGVYVFANYSTQGEHKSAVPLTQTSQIINLDAKGFKVLSVPANSKF